MILSKQMSAEERKQLVIERGTQFAEIMAKLLEVLQKNIQLRNRGMPLLNATLSPDEIAILLEGISIFQQSARRASAAPETSEQKQ